MRARESTARALPLGALRCFVAVLLCLLARAPAASAPTWLRAPSGPSSRGDEAVGVALARAPGPSLDRGASKAAHADAREAGDQGGLGPFLPPPALPLPVGAGAWSAFADRSVASPSARPSLLRPVARAPPALRRPA
ncbi:MAG TPA: hypothetical protein VFS43_13830 [Polyangiaceae bacterium]|nr:hypothetical protein [Polyangiaceae bacterium]